MSEPVVRSLLGLVNRCSPFPGSPTVGSVDIKDDPFLAFASEHLAVFADKQLPPGDAMLDHDRPPEPVVRSPKLPAHRRPAANSVALLARAVVVVVVGLAVFGVLYGGGLVDARAVEFVKITVKTEPAGADLIIDGENRGSTPLEVSLPPGGHTVVIRLGAEERCFPLMLTSGAEVVQDVEIDNAKPPPVDKGAKQSRACSGANP